MDVPQAPVAPFAPQSASGFTLIELVAALVLGSVVLGSLFALMSGTRGAARELEGGLHSLQADLGALTAFRREMNGCKLRTSELDGSALSYRLPIQAGPANGYVDDKGEVLWGVDDRDGLDPSGWLTLRFEAERTLSEATEGHDYNRDGDTVDTFEVGRLVRESDSGTRFVFPELTLILPEGNRLGDLDGDGEDDPLFSVDPARGEVTLNVVRIVRGDRFRIVPVHCMAAVATEYVAPSPAE